MEKTEILKHIKNLTPKSMTVFIDSPIHMESDLKFVPFFANDHIGLAIPRKNGLNPTNRGLYMARKAVESMTKAGLFYVSHREELMLFYAEYSVERERISNELDAAKTKTRTDPDWRNHARLIREQFDINKRLQTLFLEMYRVRFDKDSPVIYEDYFREIEKMSLKHRAR